MHHKTFLYIIANKDTVINLVLFFSGLIVLILLFSDIIFAFNKIIVTGDYVSQNPTIYLTKTFSILNPFERLGVFNYDYLFYSWLIKLYGALMYIFIQTPYAGNIFFISPVFISYLTMYLYLRKMIKNIVDITSHPKKWVAIYVVPLISIYYAINPWITNRILSGHLYIVYSYAIVPLIFMSLEDLTKNFNLKNIVKLTLLLTFAMNSIHITIILVLMLTIYFLFIILIEKTNFGKDQYLKIAFSLFILLALNLPFIISLVFSLQLHSSQKTDLNQCYSWLIENVKITNILSLRSYWWNEYTYAMYELSNVLKGLEILIYGFFISFPIIITFKLKYFRNFIILLLLIFLMSVSLPFLTAMLIGIGCTHSLGINILHYWITLYRDPDKLSMLLPFVYSNYFFMSLFFLLLLSRRIVTVFVLLVLTAYLIIYTMINPALRGSLPLNVVELTPERLLLYSEYNSMIINNVLILPTDQYLVYKWISDKQPLGELNKYLLTSTVAGPPLDPNYDYSNISFLIIDLQRKIYSDQLFNQASCTFASNFINLLNINTIIVQMDVLSYNPNIDKFLLFLNKTCNIRLYEIISIPHIKIYRIDRYPQLFSLIGNATILSVERADFTNYKILIHAKSNFLLLYHMGYDPFWETRVYRNNTFIDKIRSTPLYHTINSFWINATGDLTLVIKYIPQDWFELSLMISILTFILCVSYLVWIWKRN